MKINILTHCLIILSLFCHSSYAAPREENNPYISYYEKTVSVTPEGKYKGDNKVYLGINYENSTLISYETPAAKNNFIAFKRKDTIQLFRALRTGSKIVHTNKIKYNGSIEILDSLYQSKSGRTTLNIFTSSSHPKGGMLFRWKYQYDEFVFSMTSQQAEEFTDILIEMDKQRVTTVKKLLNQSLTAPIAWSKTGFFQAERTYNRLVQSSPQGGSAPSNALMNAMISANKRAHPELIQIATGIDSDGNLALKWHGAIAIIPESDIQNFLAAIDKALSIGSSQRFGPNEDLKEVVLYSSPNKTLRIVGVTSPYQHQNVIWLDFLWDGEIIEAQQYVTNEMPGLIEGKRCIEENIRGKAPLMAESSKLKKENERILKEVEDEIKAEPLQ